MKKILLLDVDGVLVHAKGYRAGIYHALGYVYQRMGQKHLKPPVEEDMLAFEAENIIFEWDSAALIVAALFHQVPHLLKDTFEETLDNIASSFTMLRPLDYPTLARSIPKPTDPEIKPAHAALGTLFPETPVFMELLENAHHHTAPMTQIIQNFVLGSDQFARTYNLRPQFETDSSLEKFDVANLSPENRDRMLDDPDLYPIMYTARPSLPPTFEVNWRNYSPEAEIAQRLVGLQGVPLIGYGRMQWLARQQGVKEDSFVKPSPVHGLVGIYSAILNHEPDWEKRALTLAVSDEIPVFNGVWEIIVFEDSSASILGVKQAVERIRQHYPDIQFTGVGIANDPAKIASLSKIADHVAPNINEGLEWIKNREKTA